MLVFSTHAFTEGDVLSSFFGWLYAISTHAFTEGDGVQLKRKFYWKRISTHAFTEGDISAPRVLEYECISTHAFTEGDPSRREEQPFQNYFNSRLHGRRPDQHPERDYAENHFNSRLHGRRPHSCCWAISDHQISTHAFTEGDKKRRSVLNADRYFNSRLHGRRLQIQIIFAAKHFLFLLILSKFLILAFLFHLASLRFSLHPVIFPVRISLYFSVYLPFALETCTLCHNI